MIDNYFFFDIETTSKYPSLEDFKKIDPRGYDLFVKKFKEENENLNEVYIEKSPLFPEYGKIICMSFCVFKDGKPIIRTVYNDDEKSLMEEIQRIFVKIGSRKLQLCGFSVKNYDIPWIIKKFYKYELDIPNILKFNNLKPWEINILELSEIWKGLGRTNSSLDEISYELDIESPKKKLQGDKIYTYYWKLKDKNSIMEYCEGDVLCLTEIFKKLKLY